MSLGDTYQDGDVVIESMQMGQRLIALKHQCDWWSIGGPDEVRRLIKDLEAAVDEYEGYERV